MKRTLVLLLTLLAACKPNLPFHWYDLPNSPPAQHNWPAVVLNRDEAVIAYVGSSGTLGMYQFHQILRVDSEAGDKFADVRIVFGDNFELVQLDARTRTAEGEWRPVTADQIFSTGGQALSDEGKQNFQFRTFRFPDVRPGSLLEYGYTLRSDRVQESLTRRLQAEVPILNYQFESISNDRTVTSLTAFNQKTVIEKEERGGLTHMKVQLHDLPPRVDDPWTAAWQTREVWLAWRVTAIEWRSQWLSLTETWSSALRFAAKTWFGDPQTMHPETLPGPPDGLDEMARIEWALQQTRRVEGMRRGDLDEAPHLNAIQSARRGSLNQKAQLLRALLQRAHVPAQLAAITQGVDGVLNRDFCAPGLMDTLLVYIPRHAGQDKPIWLDPGCPWCKIGEVPVPVQRAEALVLTPTGEGQSLKMRTEFVHVTGNNPRLSGIKRHYEATLLPNGDLNVTVEAEWTGGDAKARWMATHALDAQQQQKAAETFVTSRLPTAQVDHAGPEKCDLTTGRCTLKVLLTVRGYASPEMKRVPLPLGLFPSNWEALARGKRADGTVRLEPLVVDEPALVEETLDLDLPRGWTVTQQPAQEKRASVLLDSETRLALTPTEDKLHVRLQRVGTLKVGRAKVDDPCVRAALTAFDAVLPREPGAQADCPQ